MSDVYSSTISNSAVANQVRSIAAANDVLSFRSPLFFDDELTGIVYVAKQTGDLRDWILQEIRVLRCGENSWIAHEGAIAEKLCFFDTLYLMVEKIKYQTVLGKNEYKNDDLADLLSLGRLREYKEVAVQSGVMFDKEGMPEPCFLDQNVSLHFGGQNLSVRSAYDGWLKGQGLGVSADNPHPPAGFQKNARALDIWISASSQHIHLLHKKRFHWKTLENRRVDDFFATHDATFVGLFGFTVSTFIAVGLAPIFGETAAFCSIGAGAGGVLSVFGRAVLMNKYLAGAVGTRVSKMKMHVMPGLVRNKEQRALMRHFNAWAEGMDLLEQAAENAEFGRKTRFGQAYFRRARRCIKKSAGRLGLSDGQTSDLLFSLERGKFPQQGMFLKRLRMEFRRVKETLYQEVNPAEDGCFATNARVGLMAP